MFPVYLLLLATMYCGHSTAQGIVPTSHSNVTEGCQPANVVFVLDACSSNGANNLKQMTKFVTRILNLMSVSEEENRVAVLSFCTRVRTEMSLGQRQSRTQARQAVSGIRLTGGRRRATDDAIWKARRHLLRHARQGAHSVILYLAAGPAYRAKNAFRVAEIVRAEGIILFAVSVGKAADRKELRQLAFKDEKPYVMNKATAKKHFQEHLEKCAETSEPAASTATSADDASDSIMPSSSYGDDMETSDFTGGATPSPTPPMSSLQVTPSSAVEATPASSLEVTPSMSSDLESEGAETSQPVASTATPADDASDSIMPSSSYGDDMETSDFTGGATPSPTPPMSSLQVTPSSAVEATPASSSDVTPTMSSSMV